MTSNAGGHVLPATGRPREPRRKVFLRGRMQTGDEWVDVTIHNVSSRGLMAHSAARLQRGRYVEIRYRSQVMVGRVVWARRDQFGLRMRDALDLPQLLGQHQPSAAAERRTEPRTNSQPRKLTVDQRHFHSRQLSSGVQFIWLLAMAVAGALVLGIQVRAMLSQSLGIASVAMGATVNPSTPATNPH